MLVLVPLHSVEETLPVIKLLRVMCVCISVCSLVCIRVHTLALLGACSRVLNYTYILIPLPVATTEGFPTFPLWKWRDAHTRSLPQTFWWAAGQSWTWDSKQWYWSQSHFLHFLRTRWVCVHILRQKSGDEAWMINVLPSLNCTWGLHLIHIPGELPVHWASSSP